MKIWLVMHKTWFMLGFMAGVIVDVIIWHKIDEWEYELNILKAIWISLTSILVLFWIFLFSILFWGTIPMKICLELYGIWMGIGFMVGVVVDVIVWAKIDDVRGYKKSRL